MTIAQTRRQFLATLSLAGAAGLVRAPPSEAAEAPPEITSVHILKTPAVCPAASYITEELLRAEGFTDVRYVDLRQPYNAIEDMIARGEIDFTLDTAPNLVSGIDRGLGIVVLTGVHGGCVEVFVNEGVRNLAGLKGKRVGTDTFGTSGHMLLSLMVAQIGLDPGKDINWVLSGSLDPMQLFVDGKIDAFLSFPPQAQELRARHVGRVVLKTAVDSPWSQYFCCMLEGTREFVRNYPAATKRVMRAILKAADLCAADPARAARLLVDRGFTPRFDYAFEALSELPYDKWREYDPEDTLRFYALRMRESGFIKSTPQKIIAEGTDWRFLDELKRELKA
jgi:NitT/TauT family transport system substrate-binding protein